MRGLLYCAMHYLFSGMWKCLPISDNNSGTILCGYQWTTTQHCKLIINSPTTKEGYGALHCPPHQAKPHIHSLLSSQWIQLILQHVIYLSFGFLNFPVHIIHVHYVPCNPLHSWMGTIHYTSQIIRSSLYLLKSNFKTGT